MIVWFREERRQKIFLGGANTNKASINYTKNGRIFEIWEV